MALILYETFYKDDTVGFLAKFNIFFGLAMSTLTFAEDIGHKFAAGYPYVYKSQFEKNTKGLSGDEKILQTQIWPFIDKSLD